MAMKVNRRSSLVLFSALVQVIAEPVGAACLSNATLNDFFANLTGGSIPAPGSCCMFDVCGLECPVPVGDPPQGYGVAVAASIVVSFLCGVATFVLVRGRAENYFVAGRSLPLWIVAITLTASSIDTNTLLGNVDLAYRYSFWDGAVIPIGLGISLILNGLFLAHHINAECVLTLPDVFAKYYGKTVEVLASVTTVCSFICLLAGNLVGFGRVTHYVWGIPEVSAVWMAAVIIWAYVISGGLYSVAYTDVVQSIFGWSGCIVMAFWFICNESPNAPPPSIGFPGYIYPDTFGDGGPCDMYNGTNCTVYQDLCCYNTELWCPLGNGNCTRYDRGSYPTGDHRIYPHQMTDSTALAPFPNGIMWNWATIIILGIGNLGALDFQARCMASRTPNIARWGCLIAGLITFFAGIPFSYLGSLTRVYFGPDSVHSEFETDTCAVQLDLPTCAAWIPDKSAFLELVAEQGPPFLGGWFYVGLIAAAMSTASGAILAMGTVAGHNVARQLDVWYPTFVTPQNLIMVARVASLPLAAFSAVIAAYYKTSKSSAGATGYLLIVAFDIVFATTVIPLFACFYVKDPSPRAALMSMLAGILTRVLLEFTIPKDGSLLLPFDDIIFLNYGPTPSTGYPSFMDVPMADQWNTSQEPCIQQPYKDFTGVDSLSSFLCSLFVFTAVQVLERRLGRPLFEFIGGTGYDKFATTTDKQSAPDDTVKTGHENEPAGRSEEAFEKEVEPAGRNEEAFEKEVEPSDKE